MFVLFYITKFLYIIFSMILNDNMIYFVHNLHLFCALQYIEMQLVTKFQ